MDISQLLATFQTLDRKFHKACAQIQILNRHITELQTRYDRAFHANQRTQRYILRLRISTYEGVCNMYHEYARRQAEQLEVIQIAIKVRAESLDQDDDDPDSDPESWYLDSDAEMDNNEDDYMDNSYLENEDGMLGEEEKDSQQVTEEIG